MLVTLTSPPSTGTFIDGEGPIDATKASPAVVGGKASSLAKLYSIQDLSGHVPQSYALSVSFFRSWMDVLTGSDEYAKIKSHVSGNDCHYPNEEALVQACEGLKQQCMTMPLDASQEQTLDELSHLIGTDFGHGLAAVRSSAVEEDGADASFAGMFETKLGVTPSKLEWAVRACFASKFDVRVFQYMAQQGGDGDDIEAIRSLGGFALVVMEMVDSVVAGVSFSANPLNSDRDECVVDSSYGLGESVVDGSVTADHFIYDKVNDKLVEKVVGCKKVERRLNLADAGGDVKTIRIEDEQRQNACSLSDEQLADLVHLTCIIEKEYGTPMDVEWAIDENDNIVLLQARPITTLFWLDDAMMTTPGEPRRLYFDYNIASDATTIAPFTTMDLETTWDVWAISFGFASLIGNLPNDPNHLMFNGCTRQYFNVSALSKLGYGPKAMAKEYKTIDLYAASVMDGDEAAEKGYKADKLPSDVTFRNAWWLLKTSWKPGLRMYRQSKKFKKDPLGCAEELEVLRTKARSEMKNIVAKGPGEDGLVKYLERLCQAAGPVLSLQSGGALMTIGIMKKLSKQQKEGKTQQERDDASAMMLGYTGDPLMEMNIAMYNLAQALPIDMWDEYDEKLSQLSERINRNVCGEVSDLPASFVTMWKSFIDEHGYDGSNQLFVSSPRYHERTDLLLEKLRHSAGTLHDPKEAMIRARQRRQEAQERQLNEVKANATCLKSSVKFIQKRNGQLDNIMWVRNAPKLFQSEIYSAFRTGVLSCEKKLLEAGRLDEVGDIFHLKVGEVDAALADASLDLRKLSGSRKAQYLRAKQSPFLFDSRGRILKPNVKEQEYGTLIGMPISPGVATGTVRILTNPREKLNKGDILATTVTDPAWTPLFIGCSAVILQVGGALQHGALCAREYGLPGVSCIDMADLKSGMKVTVDGNTGVVTIISTNRA